MPTTIADELKNATEQLFAAKIPDARREASSLLQYAIKKNRTYIIAHPEYQLTADEHAQFIAFLQRRMAREPFHYIVGTKEFFGLSFNVTPAVLIPRPETEMLVIAAIEFLKDGQNSRFCEVGVGSGCISTAVLHNVERTRAIGLEISGEAILMAEQNLKENGVSERIEIRKSDAFSALTDEVFDLIVSNPPYIAAADIDALQPEVQYFEPLSALTDGENGLTIIEKLIKESPKYLQPGGKLLLEIGLGQADGVREMFDTNLWHEVNIIADFQSIPRMVSAIKINNV